MPTYEYECDACGHTFERFQSITADPVKTCPECKKRKVRRLFGTGGAIVFKGSGFYQTDYRSESYKKGAKAETDSTGGKASDKSAGNEGEKSSSGDAKDSVNSASASKGSSNGKDSSGGAGKQEKGPAKK